MVEEKDTLISQAEDKKKPLDLYEFLKEVFEKKKVMLYVDSQRIIEEQNVYLEYFEGGIGHIINVDSQRFKSWIIENVLQFYNRTPSDKFISDAHKVIKYSLSKSAKMKKLLPRIVHTKKHDKQLILYDLGFDENYVGRFAKLFLGKVTLHSFTETKYKNYEPYYTWEFFNSPILLPQPTPILSENYIEDFKRIHNYIRVKSETDKQLLEILILSYFIREFEHPILYFMGEKGSAKTTSATIIKLLVDPSSPLTLGLSKRDDLEKHYIKFTNQWLVVLDNVSLIDDDLSDFLSRVISQEGVIRRALYTNGAVYSDVFRNAVILTGIQNVIRKPDLMDRTILIELVRVPSSEIKPKEELIREFEEDKPYILGGALQIVAKALHNYDKVKDEVLSFIRSVDYSTRLLTFLFYGEAISRELGYDKFSFVKNYILKMTEGSMQVLEENPLAGLIYDFLTYQKTKYEKDEFEFYATELFNELKKYAMEHGYETNLINAVWLGRKLRDLAEDMRRIYHIDFDIKLRGNRRKYVFKFKKTEEIELINETKELILELLSVNDYNKVELLDSLPSSIPDEIKEKAIGELIDSYQVMEIENNRLRRV